MTYVYDIETMIKVIWYAPRKDDPNRNIGGTLMVGTTSVSLFCQRRIAPVPSRSCDMILPILNVPQFPSISVLYTCRPHNGTFLGQGLHKEIRAFVLVIMLLPFI